MKQAPILKGIDFRCCSYETYDNLKGYVIYCDPPYKNATQYYEKSFDYENFYNWCRKMAKYNTVLVSEYSMPEDFTCIWSQKTKVSLDSKKKESDDKNIRIEKLFTYIK